MKDVLTALRERCSTRGYTAEKLTETEVQTMLAAGLHAPTAINRREIHFTVLPGDHSWSNWNVTKEADCTAPGSETR